MSELRQAREDQGLTLTEAARAADISVSHLSRVERGERCLSMGALSRLAQVVGLGPGDVLTLLSDQRRRAAA